jgi:hypothetical protein
MSFESIDFSKLNKVYFLKDKHCRLLDLGYNNIHHFNKQSPKRWNWYIENKGIVYLEKYTTKYPMYKRLIFDKIALKHLKKGSPLPPKKKIQKRTYKKGGQLGKAEGLNLYIQKNDKLTKSDRETLLRESEILIDEILSKHIPKIKIDYLDSSHTDIELIEIWNKIYFKYGYLISEFRRKTEPKLKDFGSPKNAKFENTLSPKMRKMLESKKAKYVNF